MSDEIEQVRAGSLHIIHELGGEPANVVVMSCLDAALRIVQGGGGLTRLQGIDVLIEALQKIRKTEEDYENQESSQGSITPKSG